MTHKFIFEQAEPSNGLFEAVWGKIQIERMREAQKRALFFMVTSVFSVIFMVFSANYFFDQIYLSGFYDFASLIVSDFDSIVYFGKEIAFSLSESLPLLSITLVLVSLIFLLESIKAVVKNLTGINSINQLLFNNK